MEEIDRQGRKALRRLCAILDAGEKGYAVAAANVDNRAMKMLLKSYARQRADYQAELQEWAADDGPNRYSPIRTMAMIHRGRINIFAAMTIGDLNRERVVLKEVLVGEWAASREYQKALRSALPGRLDELLRVQYEGIRAAVEQIRLMRGNAGKQLVLRLYDSDAAARRAAAALQEAGLTRSRPDQVHLEAEMQDYIPAGHSRLFETILSGACGGALWGAVSGALAGIGVIYLPTLGLQHASLAIQEMAWAETALGAILAGGFVGGMLGGFIGWGIDGGDAYLYRQSQQHGQILLKLETEQARATQAAEIMSRVNRQVQSQGRHAGA